MEISVIVPVYNAADYVATCVTSVLKQTASDFELLLVDDGSTDNSLEVCQKLANKDARIKVIHMENAGVSAARNIGLDNAQGDYIAFIDSDDLVSTDYLEYLISGMSDDTVLSMCSHARIHDYHHQFPMTHEQFGELTAQQAAKKLLSGNFPVAVCGGLFRRELISDLRFPVGIRNNEDKLFLYQYLLRKEEGTVAFSKDKMYGYMVRDGSATRRAWNGSLDVVTVADQIRMITEEDHPEWNEMTKNASLKARFDIMNSIILAEKTEHGEQVYDNMRKEALEFGFPKTGGKRLQVEYIAARLGKPFYHALTKTYYKLYSDQRRFQLNEKKTRQG